MPELIDGQDIQPVVFRFFIDCRPGRSPEPLNQVGHGVAVADDQVSAGVYFERFDELIGLCRIVQPGLEALGIRQRGRGVSSPGVIGAENTGDFRVCQQCGQVFRALFAGMRKGRIILLGRFLGVPHQENRRIPVLREQGAGEKRKWDQ